MVNEKNLINSFRLAKSDIISIQGELMQLKKQQAEIFLRLEELIEKRKSAPRKKTKTKRKRKTEKSRARRKKKK